MFRVQAPIIVLPTTEAREALGTQLRPAGLAAWREIARRGQGREKAHFQINRDGVTLAVRSRLRRDGFIGIEPGLGNPRSAARVIRPAELRRAGGRVLGRHGPPLRSR